MTADYAELRCLSNFSFLCGASHPDELVAQAHALGYRALAITDECSVAGVVRAHVAAKEVGLKLIIGSEIQLEDGPRLVLLAPARRAYGQLCALISLGRSAAPKGRYRLRREDLENALPDCLAILTEEGLPAAEAVDWFRERFGRRGWLGLSLRREQRDAERLAQMETLARRHELPLLACGGVLMHVRGRRALQDTLTAIRLGRPLSELGHALQANGERHLRPRATLARLYPAALLRETINVAERCSFSLDELRYEYPHELVPSGFTPVQHLRRLTLDGAKTRWPAGLPEKVTQLIEHELQLIEALRYEPFFLTVHDVVRFARDRGILCQGRGSAANSAVCFCLGITDVDPAKMSLLFERFISRERGEPPDIDVDFEHERREEVIQYVYQKYGRHRAALAATVISYRPRSALRDVGKALGMAPHQVERLSKAMSWWDGRAIRRERIEAAGFDPDNPILRRVLTLANSLGGFPRHLSQHVGGFVISAGPLCELVPTENAAMAGRTIIQWDKDDLEALGLLKVDCLALGMLTAIRKTFALIERHRGRSWSIATVPAEDAATYRMIQRADTIGVFQIESRAQMAMLPRMLPEKFYDLVIEVALVRPGPIQGDMVHPYLRRREGSEPISYPSEAVKGVLERTLGVPIFQEQVMQLAMAAAGFSPGEADALRRAMAAWRRKGGLEHFQTRLTQGMLARGYTQEFAAQICRQIQGFGEYGFPESHAASFAQLAYVSAWLKCHEPAAFTCALLNSQPMGFYAPAQLVRDAREHGVEVRPADVTVSDWDCTLEADSRHRLALRLGLRLVRGLSEAAAQRLVAARARRPWRDLQNLARRAALNKHDLSCLAHAGALKTLAGHRRAAWWEVLGVETELPVFPELEIREPRPPLPPPTEGEDLRADYASTGLTLGRHPLALLRPQLKRLRLRSAAELQQVEHKRLVRTAGLVITRQRPGTSSGVTFLTLEDETGTVNVVVWRDLAERARQALLGARLLGVIGIWERRDAVTHLIAGRLEDHSHLLGELDITSRDFH
jgi:error-prone DNA polymerase